MDCGSLWTGLTRLTQQGVRYPSRSWISNDLYGFKGGLDLRILSIGIYLEALRIITARRLETSTLIHLALGGVMIFTILDHWGGFLHFWKVEGEFTVKFHFRALRVHDRIIS